MGAGSSPTAAVARQRGRVNSCSLKFCPRPDICPGAPVGHGPTARLNHCAECAGGTRKLAIAEETALLVIPAKQVIANALRQQLLASKPVNKCGLRFCLTQICKGSIHSGGGGDLFLARKDLGRMFDYSSPPAIFFFFFLSGDLLARTNSTPYAKISPQWLTS